MIYDISFNDESFIYTSQWIDSININIRLEVDDKIVIHEGCFQANLFSDGNKQSRLNVIEELNSIANARDYIYGPETIGCYRFAISDIEYWPECNEGSAGIITLKKITL